MTPFKKVLPRIIAIFLVCEFVFEVMALFPPSKRAVAIILSGIARMAIIYLIGKTDPFSDD